MYKIFLLLLFSFILFTGCSQENEKEITISTNQWIGYAPLFYAYEKGYLDKLNIKIINNVSLAEAAELYRVGKANMVTTTQHEYNMLKHETQDIIPIILLDRSNGGDMVLSNKSIQELHSADKIYVYLEVDSINQEIIRDFIKHNGLDIKKMTFINQDQQQIQDVKFKKNRATLIVTYTPYNIHLEKKGFFEVASTKNIDAIIVIDALCTTSELLKHDKKRLLALKRSIDKSIDVIMKDPKASHQIIKKYISNMSYREYLTSLDSIKWINKPSKELLNYISDLDYKEEYIIQ
ncbi:ABC transporter substrate-binding protein [Sulfurimonas sp.]|uniref:ABC transporter substrate-binding protein n=1 Tax=Sulfurimonas sp. TaxID=2022749 RepID=UPI00260686DC|nr:ABC transporter substrate-binding protein [Sulfurimonas sp.]